jgi:hypothetical protein
MTYALNAIRTLSVPPLVMEPATWPSPCRRSAHMDTTSVSYRRREGKAVGLRALVCMLLLKANLMAPSTSAPAPEAASCACMMPATSCDCGTAPS